MAIAAYGVDDAEEERACVDGSAAPAEAYREAANGGRTLGYPVANKAVGAVDCVVETAAEAERGGERGEPRSAEEERKGRDYGAYPVPPEEGADGVCVCVCEVGYSGGPL